ncbi:hypothetical protein D3C72_1541780 [compost metagenome]
MQAGQRIAHFAFDFSLGHQRRHRVDDDQVNRTRAHQRVGDFQRLFARVRLRDQQIGQVHAQLVGVLHVQRMFRVDERAGAADFLHFGDDLQRQRGLARRFRAVDFNHAATRQAADAQRDVQTQRSRGNHLDVVRDLVVAVAHDRALAELLFDLRKRGGKRLGLFRSGGLGGFVVHVESCL